MAHGNKDYFVFENDKFFHKIQFDCNLWTSFMTQYKFSQFAENLKSALKTDGTIWLFSCFTGCGDSVAKKIATLTGRVVYGPNDMIFSSEVDVIYKDNKLKLKLIDDAFTRENRSNKETDLNFNTGYSFIKFNPPEDQKNKALFKSAYKRNQKKSKEVKRSQKRSKEIKRNQKESKEVKRSQKKSKEVKRSQKRSKEVKRGQKKSKEIKKSQKKSKEIKRNQKR
jgi:hypothetical protein